jgi:Uncharacterised protein family (UPF0158)
VGEQWQERGQLRGAIYRRDRAELLRLLASSASTDRLQLAGAGVLVCLVGDERPSEVARRLSAALRARSWPGDEELAEEIDAALVGAGTGRRPVPVDLSELADLLEGGQSGDADGLLDLATGQIWPGELLADPAPALDLPDVDEDPDRWLAVPPRPSHDGWRDMRDFAELLPEPARQRLGEATDGRGAFSRFRRELDRAGEDVRDQWLAFREERALGRARAWLADEGCTVEVS